MSCQQKLFEVVEDYNFEGKKVMTMISYTIETATWRFNSPLKTPVYVVMTLEGNKLGTVNEDGTEYITLKGRTARGRDAVELAIASDICGIYASKAKMAAFMMDSKLEPTPTPELEPTPEPELDTQPDNRAIVTTHETPPIPTKAFDWSASREDWDLGDFVGHGPTEESAIADLLDLEGY